MKRIDESIVPITHDFVNPVFDITEDDQIIVDKNVYPYTTPYNYIYSDFALMNLIKDELKEGTQNYLKSSVNLAFCNQCADMYANTFSVCARAFLLQAASQDIISQESSIFMSEDIMKMMCKSDKLSGLLADLSTVAFIYATTEIPTDDISVAMNIAINNVISEMHSCLTSVALEQVFASNEKLIADLLDIAGKVVIVIHDNLATNIEWLINKLRYYIGFDPINL